MDQQAKRVRLHRWVNVDEHIHPVRLRKCQRLHFANDVVRANVDNASEDVATQFAKLDPSLNSSLTNASRALADIDEDASCQPT